MCADLWFFFYIFLEAQVNTQQYGRRPYGVGLLVIGHDVSSVINKGRSATRIDYNLL